MPVSDQQFDKADYNRSFYGVHSTYTGREKATFDFYYLGSDNQTNGVACTTDFSLHTFGSQVAGIAGDGWLYKAPR